MNRRSFMAASASVASGAGLGVVSSGEAHAAPQRANGGGMNNGNRKQVLDLRRYTFASPEKFATFESFVATGLVPALNRQGIQPVGAFKMTKADNPEAKFEGDTSLELFVLVPHSSLESVATLDAKLAADTIHAKALVGLNETAKDPAYARYESSLLLAFDDCPQVEVPTRAATRVLQLRIYEAYNAERSRMKVRMFNAGGEIRIFREVGMNPVFFGHAFAGVRLPNLTYMLGFENDEAMKAAWSKFGAHPDWQKLRIDPIYQDTVSSITNFVLHPLSGSQI